MSSYLYIRSCLQNRSFPLYKEEGEDMWPEVVSKKKVYEDYKRFCAEIPQIVEPDHEFWTTAASLFYPKGKAFHNVRRSLTERQYSKHYKKWVTTKGIKRVILLTDWMTHVAWFELCTGRRINWTYAKMTDDEMQTLDNMKHHMKLEAVG